MMDIFITFHIVSIVRPQYGDQTIGQTSTKHSKQKTEKVLFSFFLGTVCVLSCLIVSDIHKFQRHTDMYLEDWEVLLRHCTVFACRLM